MRQQQVERALESALEELACIEHERWSHWQLYMHKKGEKMSDGSLVIPPELVEKWEKQISTSYYNLSEKEKESDRDQVRKYLPVVIRAISRV